MPTSLFRRAARSLDDWLAGELVTAPVVSDDWQELPPNLEWDA
jgi:hypothetical protein